MDEKIRRLIEEIPEGEHGVLSLSVEQPEWTADPGETIEGSFLALSDNGHPIEGFVTVDEPRFRVLTPHFFGASEEIGFSFRTEGMQEGDACDGRFVVVTDCGEQELTIRVTVRDPYPVIRDETGEEKIRNLFHFANLARRDFDEAAHLFYSPRLLHLFRGADRKYYSIYRGLSGTDSGAEEKGLHVEEFLIAIRKKEPMAYTVDRAEILLEAVTEDTEEILKITRRGWGYTALEIITDGPFLEVVKDTVRERDFLGNTCRLPVVIRFDKLHAGRNYGRITFKNNHTLLQVTVTCVRAAEADIKGVTSRAGKREKQQAEADLIRTYVDYRMGRMRSREWLIETGKIVSRMNAMAPEDVIFQLYTAHYLITASREAEAIWVLDKVRTSVEETCSYGETMRAYFLYLETLISREDTKIGAVEEILKGMLARHPDDWRIAWLAQFLYDDRATGNARRMKLYAEQFAYGCRSPILYIEAIDLMGKDPTNLKKFDDFTLYCLSFAARKGEIPHPLIDRVVWMALREKHGSKRLYRILSACYDQDPDSGAVDATCSLLIKDARTDAEAFAWYERAVERDSRLTRLYEYYMMAYPMPQGDEIPRIPRMVLLFFSYRSELPYDKNALLYRCVLSLREEDPELYHSYVPQMERFVAEQMARGRIDRNLSILYLHFAAFTPKDPVGAERFFEALYTTELTVPDPDVRRIVVVYDRLRAERVFPVMSDKAMIPLYSEHAAILTEDRRGRRQIYTARGGKKGEKPRMLKDILGESALVDILPYMREGNGNVNLYLTEADRMTITADNVDRYRRLASSDVLMPRARTEVSCALIRFYYDNDFVRQLADYLPESHPERMSGRQRSDALEMMVLSGIYDQAAEWIRRFGLSDADEKTCYRLCTRSIARGDFPEDDAATMLAWAVFRTGKYDEGVLRHLADHYQGAMRDETAVYRACTSFSVDPVRLAERILTQLLFTGAHAAEEEEVFRSVVTGGGRSDIQKAFLVRACTEALHGGKLPEAFMIDRIRTFAHAGEMMPKSLMLGWLKVHADPACRNAHRGDEEVTNTFLEALTEEETELPFLTVYSDRVPQLALADGRKFVQYTGVPGSAVTIWILEGAAQMGRFVPRRMHEPYPGIFTYGEVLFPGESICYYLTVRQIGDDTERLTTSGILARDLTEDTAEGNTRYALLARFLKARTQNDREAEVAAIEEICRNDFLSSKLFPLPGEG